MRLIRRLLLLTIVGIGGVAAYAYWSDSASLPRPGAALGTEMAKRQGARLANEAAAKASKAADKLGDTVAEGALTAKIKSKMALDDHVSARAIDVDTSGSVATLTGLVASEDERRRAVQLARDTEGVTRVIDKLQIRER